MSGIICGNSGHCKVGNWSCDRAWHTQCYQQSKSNKFLVLFLLNLDDSLINKSAFEKEYHLRFKEARYWDHMLVPFQYDLCHFVNIYQRFLVLGNHWDNLFLLCIQQVKLDSMWVR